MDDTDTATTIYSMKVPQGLHFNINITRHYAKYMRRCSTFTLKIEATLQEMPRSLIVFVFSISP